MAKLVSSGGWNVPTKMMESNVRPWIYEGYRTIEAETLEEAIEFMEKYYTGVKDDVFYEKSKHWYNPCHYTYDTNKYSFIAFKQTIK